ncbi:protein tipE [Nilaparvata lugens]|uniref:protein tipE n=1 Tax=Nilaparvata lugens TaxID=108931 RepID=UPI00193C9AD2|nr:protein tipE [Nilaparvata lugens]
MADDVKKEQTTSEKLLFYTTTFFVLLGTFSLFGFLFLVPFVIEPAFTTILMEFDETPATCMTVSTVSMRGVSNCSWTSCREGCTKEVYECTQIRVNYRLLKDEDEDQVTSTKESTVGARRERAIRESYDYHLYEDDVLPRGLADFDPVTTSSTPNDNSSYWFFTDAKLYPNVKGCGYPPMLNCSIFFKKYITEGTNFSCHYSRVDPGLVISDLDMWGVYMNLVYAMAIPIPSFIISVIYLTVAYFYIYSDDSEPPPRRPPRRRPLGGASDVEVTPLPATTPVPPPTSGALTPNSELFREDMASFGHHLKVAMADDMSRDSMLPDSLPFLSSASINGNLNKMMTTSILTPPGPMADV